MFKPLIYAFLFLLSGLWSSSSSVVAETFDCSSLQQTSFGGWSKTDFRLCAVDPLEILSGGPAKDGIPAIDHPKFIPIQNSNIGAENPVIAVEINHKARAYPLEILMWHEIVNDVFENQPISVTFCPLCNASIVFSRKVDGRTLDFGVTGKLRHSDMIMYDRQTESWWQQYGGTGLIGKYIGTRLDVVPSSVIALADFQEKYPNGEILVPNNPHTRQYGTNPYIGYDQSARPFLFRGETPVGIPPLERVVVLEDIAFSFSHLRKNQQVEHKGKILRYQKGVRSALQEKNISDSADIGTILVTQDGKIVEHKLTFAFVVHAFEPEKKIIHP